MSRRLIFRGTCLECGVMRSVVASEYISDMDLALMTLEECGHSYYYTGNQPNPEDGFYFRGGDGEWSKYEFEQHGDHNDLRQRLEMLDYCEDVLGVRVLEESRQHE